MGVGKTVDHAQRNASKSKSLNQSTRQGKEMVMEMLLYLANKIHELGGDIQRFFRTAYMWRFGKDYDCVNDVCQYKLHAIVPKYVQEYIKHIQ